MEKSKIESFRGKLQKERKRLENELKQIHDENYAVASEGAEGGDENYEDHMGDAASNIFDRERDLSLEQNLEDMIAQVDAALLRLENGSYGICANCHREINEARLRAIPYVDLCIECKQAEEQHR